MYFVYHACTRHEGSNTGFSICHILHKNIWWLGRMKLCKLVAHVELWQESGQHLARQAKASKARTNIEGCGPPAGEPSLEGRKREGQRG